MISSDGPAEPLGWQPGLDWEVRTIPGGYRAELYRRRDLLAVVESRWRPVLTVRMALAQRRARAEE